MGTQCTTHKDERNLDSEDSVIRIQAQGGSTEMKRREPNRCDDQLADHHPKDDTHVRNDDGVIGKTLSHSAAAKKACTELDDTTLLLKESCHRSDDKSGEQGIQRSRVGQLSAPNILLRRREINPVDAIGKRILYILE